MRRWWAVTGAVLVAVLAVGSSAGASTTTATTAAPTITLPPVGARFDYQIGGPYRPAAGVGIVDRDMTATPAPGVYDICYVNAFQTQPGQLRGWQARHPGLLLRRDGGLVHDPGWPGEVLLDTSTPAKRAALARVIGGDLARCAAKGFEAVEPDNLDSWTRSHRLLTEADNLAFAGLLAQRAHGLGLAIAQKNAAGIGARGRTVAHLDFAIAEECQVYQECADYTRVYGRHVIEIEYTDNGRAAFRTACRRRGASISIVLRDRDVVPRGAPGYVSRWCSGAATMSPVVR